MRALLTGTADQVERLAARLRDEGIEPVECPLLATVPVGDGPIRADGHDWLVVTSRSAVEHLFARLEGPLPKVAAIGPGTAEALRARGVEPALVPGVSTQEGLVAVFPERPGRVLFAGAEDARALVVDTLGADYLPIYRTVERLPLELPPADLAVLASGSAARALLRAGGRLPCVSIGPTTTAAAREVGLDVVEEAAGSDLDGLVEAVRLAASKHSPSPSPPPPTGTETPRPRSSRS